MSRLKELIHEVHRRSLWQVLLVYVGASWAVLAVVDTLAGALGLPDWAPRLAFFLLVIGLPIVLATAFVQEGTPEAPPRGSRASTNEAGVPGPASAASGGEGPSEGSHLRERFLTWRNALLGGVAAFALWGVVAAGWLLLGDDPGPAAGSASELPASLRTSEFAASVAVLPFKNLGREDDEFLTEGITEEVIAQLAQVGGLKVISRTSVVALQGSGLTLPQIADTLRVEHVLEGSVRRAGEQARITVQLIEAASDAHLWAESYDRALVNLFEVQQEIAHEVTRALLEQVPSLRPMGRASRTANSAAYETYLRGRQLLHRRTRESLLGAMEAFQEAARLDPQYAPTYAAHAAALALWPHYGYPGGPDPYAAHAEAIALADRALALDPDLADAYAARGLALTHAWAPASETAADFVRAVEIQPNSADIHGWYAHLLTREEDFEAGLEAAQRAIDLDPIAPGRRVGYAIDALGARRYDLVLRETRAARAIEPSLGIPRAWEGLALLLLGRPSECLELELTAFRGVRAMCLYASGRTRKALGEIEASIEELDSYASGEALVDAATAVEDVATYYAWVGDRERAFDWLERAFGHSPDGVEFRYVQSGLFDRIRGDPGFQRRFVNHREAAWERVRRMARGR